MLKDIEKKVLEGTTVSRKEARFIASISGQDIFELFSSASRIREQFRGNAVDLCAIINAKSGACPEDCSYCAQSARYKTGVEPQKLLSTPEVVAAARRAKELGASAVLHGRRVEAGWWR